MCTKNYNNIKSCMRYKSKTRYVDAIQWTGNNLEEVLAFIGKCIPSKSHEQYIKNNDNILEIPIDKGMTTSVQVGEYIVKDNINRFSQMYEYEFKNEFEKFDGLAYQFNIVLGDWGDDGHGKTETFCIECNYPKQKVEEAYHSAVAKTDFNFAESICSKYDDSQVSKEQLSILKEIGVDSFITDDVIEDSDGIYCYCDDYIELLFGFIKIVLPDLDYAIIPQNIFRPNCDYFGYGLFY
nr:MAG TPA: hypothetical protein [Caudoviricetes sp.]